MKTANSKYLRYIKDRVNSHKAKYFDGEYIVRKAIVSYNERGRFFLLQLNSDDCNIYECETNDAGNMFRIKSYDTYSHRLGEVFNHNLTQSNLEKYSFAYFNQDGKYVYDKYYDNLSSELAEHNKALQQALRELPDIWGNASLYIDGNYSEIPSVVYALQRNAAKVIPMRLVKPSSEANPDTIKCIFPEIIKEQIRTNNGITFLDCIKEPKTVFVPLEPKSLESVFYREIKWKDIIPNMDKDCEIAGIDCKYIILKTEVDGFQNMFCCAKDAHGNNKSVLVYNALNVSVDVVEEVVVTPSSLSEKEYEQDILVDSSEEGLSSIGEQRDRRIEENGEMNEDTFSHTTKTPPTENGKRYSELVEEIDIMTGDTGHSYSTLFGKYLSGASSVVLAEPYIVHPHQWDNLKEFISLLIEVGRVNYFRLITQKPELVKLPDYMERTNFISDFNTKLMSIKNEISCSHVDFSWKLSNIHKRWLDIDDYHMDLDYGLDLYVKPEKGTVLSSVQVLRKCKENHIKVYKHITA